MSSVLILKFGALGDVCLASPAILEILRRHPRQSVILLTAKAFIPLFASISDLECIPWDRGSLLNQIRTYDKLRLRSFDRIYDLQGSHRSRWLTYLLPASERVGLWPGWPYNLSSPYPKKPKRHALNRLDHLLNVAFPSRSPGEVLRLHPSIEALNRVDKWLEAKELSNSRLVLLHPGSSLKWETKRWPEANFLEVASYLSLRNYCPVWIGGPDETHLVQRLADKVGHGVDFNLSLGDLQALARRAAFAVTNDSGPMHLLAASGLPVYSFFGPTNSSLSHALGQSSRTLESQLPCRPCHQPKCPISVIQPPCLSSISAKEVISRLTDDAWFQNPSAEHTSPDTEPKSLREKSVW